MKGGGIQVGPPKKPGLHQPDTFSRIVEIGSYCLANIVTKKQLASTDPSVVR